MFSKGSRSWKDFGEQRERSVSDAPFEISACRNAGKEVKNFVIFST